ncbi:MAG: hypothetical protein EXR79_17570, partial [Myxococcales bacterium]|nr:hypothetical protein [Myxococcales bacterium]
MPRSATCHARSRGHRPGATAGCAKGPPRCMRALCCQSLHATYRWRPMSHMTIDPISHKVFGASVTGISLGALGDADFAIIKAAFLKYGFLLFPGQFLTDAENIAFGTRFGELEFGAAPMANQEKREDGSYGGILALDSQRMRTNIGNEAWHTDSTYKPVSS